MTFERFLASTNADADTVHGALWMHLAEVTGDLTPDEMRDQLRAAVVDPELFEKELAALPTDPRSIETAALAYFAELWTDKGARASIRAAFTEGKRTHPVVGSKAMVMYAMYIAAMHRALVALAGGKARATQDSCSSSTQARYEAAACG